MTDRETVVKELEGVLDWLFEGEDRKCVAAYRAVEDALELLKEQEAVVRCKDCKYWRQNTEFCGRWSVGNAAQHTPPDWYCADGERR